MWPSWKLKNSSWLIFSTSVSRNTKLMFWIEWRCLKSRSLWEHDKWILWIIFWRDMKVVIWDCRWGRGLGGLRTSNVRQFDQWRVVDLHIHLFFWSTYSWQAKNNQNKQQNNQNHLLQYRITFFREVVDSQKYIFLKSPWRELSKNIYFCGLATTLKKVIH